MSTDLQEYISPSDYGNSVFEGRKLVDEFPNGIQVQYDQALNVVWYSGRHMNIGYDLASNTWRMPPSVHPWLDKDGLADYMRIMRGEEKLPHSPLECEECNRIFKEQESILRMHDILPSPHRKRNPGRKKMQARIEQVNERLRVFTQCVEVSL